MLLIGILSAVTVFSICTLVVILFWRRRRSKSQNEEDAISSLKQSSTRARSMKRQYTQKEITEGQYYSKFSTLCLLKKLTCFGYLNRHHSLWVRQSNFPQCRGDRGSHEWLRWNSNHWAGRVWKCVLWCSWGEGIILIYFRLIYYERKLQDSWIITTMNKSGNCNQENEIQQL